VKNILKQPTVYLFLILIFGFVVRLYKINTPLADWHSWRQVDTASVSRNYVDNGINILFPTYHDVSSIQSGYVNPHGYRFVEFPIYNVLHALLAKNFPVWSLEVWGRLVSIVCSVVSMVMIYVLGNKYIGKWGGVLAAFFFAFIPYNIFFSRVILPEPMATMFGLMALVAFSFYIERGKAGLLYLSGLTFALAILVKPFIAFYGIVMIYLLLDKYKPREILTNSKLLINLFIFVDIVLVPLFAWRAWIGQFPAGIPFSKWMFNGDGIRFRPAFWRWIFVERLGKMILAVWGLPLFVVGASWIGKKKYFIQAFLFSMLAYVSIVATANVRHDYYQVFLVPAVSLACSAGVVYLLKAEGLSRFMSKIMVVLSIFLMVGIGFYQIKDNYNINHPEIIAAGVEVDKIVPKDAWVVAPYNGDTAFLYQTKRWGWPAVDTDFGTLITRGADYYVSVNLGDSDTKFVREHFKVLEENPQFMIADLHQIVVPLETK